MFWALEERGNAKYFLGLRPQITSLFRGVGSTAMQMWALMKHLVENFVYVLSVIFLGTHTSKRDQLRTDFCNAKTIFYG